MLNQWNVCFFLSSSPLLIKSQSQVEVETRDHINLLNLVFMKHFQSKRGIDLNREGELRAHATHLHQMKKRRVLGVLLRHVIQARQVVGHEKV